MNLPTDFVTYTHGLFGDEEYNKLAEALQEDSPISIRLNASKGAFPVSLTDSVSVPWCSDGYYLPERLTFTFDPLFHAGCYYVQEASSMFLERVIKQYVQTSVVMLDLCAAPGGKSTHAISLLPAGSLLVANEVIRSRSSILGGNLTKWGKPNVIVTNNDPADFTKVNSFFDVILADVPCSGEGMFRKDAGAIAEWNLNNVEICWQRQRRIIADVWPCLKPGGIFIYSTCTYNTKEDEENIAWMQHEFEAEVLSIDVPESWGICGNMAGYDFPVYRFLPHNVRGEGFFLTVLRKSASEELASRSTFRSVSLNAADKRNKDSRKKLPDKEVTHAVKDWVIDYESYQFTVNGTLISAFPKAYFNELNSLQQLHIAQSGIAIGEVKGKDIIPNHALAMSQMLNPDAFPSIELSYEQAIAYLRKEAISLGETAPRGYLLVTYNNVFLGFVKNIGNRANNLYPQEWRIRSGYLPLEIKLL
ncbi:rRNA cytosine-C5-methyltransferase [uncultured Bacteroides sp.]|uniref:methyltransferase RsmF C-terminal domain-like protein n=1 Tax=uncultured Bacteroides sp. TaxID=162156 RepID=UPI002AA61178|nr:rRNA cytosine-C5-methyltransferase [uncultured Bacteroides sp.]